MFYKCNLIQTEPPTQQAPCSGNENFWLTNSGLRFTKLQEWLNPTTKVGDVGHVVTTGTIRPPSWHQPPR